MATLDNQQTDRDKYEALAQLYAATEQDFTELRLRFDNVQSNLKHTRLQNDYLINQLCSYAPSDFESDQSDLEKDDDLLDKQLPLPKFTGKATPSSKRKPSVASTTKKTAAVSSTAKKVTTA